MAKLGDLLSSKKVTKNVTKKVNGYTLFEGKSLINGEPIVGIITVKSTNVKTGNMAQLWILRADMSPVESSKAKKDDAVCGSCKLRQSLGGACYVNLGQGPNSVYKAFKRGNYPKLSVDDYNRFEGLKIRFGAYGDPYALPIDILAKLKAVASNNTSYTHQWKQGGEVLKSVSMASVDNIAEQIEAVASGWRTFRVATSESEVLSNEIVCPNTTNGISCADCGLCSGASKNAKNIVILAHGTLSKRFKD